jgi:hypothetical protein
MTATLAAAFAAELVAADFAASFLAGLVAAGFDAAAAARVGTFADLRLTAAFAFALAKLRSSCNIKIGLQGRAF